MYLPSRVEVLLLVNLVNASQYFEAGVVEVKGSNTSAISFSVFLSFASFNLRGAFWSKLDVTWQQSLNQRLSYKLVDR